MGAYLFIWLDPQQAMTYTLTDLATRSAASESELLGLFKIKAFIPLLLLPSNEVGTKTSGHSLAIF